MDLDLIVKLIGSLAVVIGLLLATLYIMKRQGFAVNDAVHIQTSVSVGPKERIMLVKCGQEQILVGVTSSNIRTLHILESEVQPSSEVNLQMEASAIPIQVIAGEKEMVRKS